MSVILYECVLSMCVSFGICSFSVCVCACNRGEFSDGEALEKIEVGGYLPADFPSVETMAVAADHQLFVSIASNPYHVLRHPYHEKEACGYNLRARPHNFALPAKDDNNFVSRSLYAELKT